MPLCGRKALLTLLKKDSFFVRFEWLFLRPGLLAERRRAQGLSRRPEGPAKRLGLDSREHGAMLTAGLGMHSQVPVSLNNGTKQCQNPILPLLTFTVSAGTMDWVRPQCLQEVPGHETRATSRI